jgi:predicted dehydrogenase
MLADLRFGILGLGSIGARHATNLLSLGAEVIAFDPSEEARSAAEAKFIPLADEREAVLENSAAIIIASPNACHLEDLKDAVAHDCHCFAEKPLAHVADGVKEVLDQAAGNNLVVFAGLNLRFEAAVMAAKGLIDGNALGAPLWASFQSSHWLPDWRPNQDYSQGYTADPETGGVLFDIIHEFDLANHLLGPAETIFAAARNTGMIEIPSEDCADIVLGHESGVRSVLHLDYVTRPTRRFAEIGGDKGILRLDLVMGEVTLIDHTGAVTEKQIFGGEDPNKAYLEEMSTFVDCIESKSAPPCDGIEALAILEQVIQARKMCGLPGS